jgi:microcystin-dependent protein
MMKKQLSKMELFAGDIQLIDWVPCDGRTIDNSILAVAIGNTVGPPYTGGPAKLPNLPAVNGVKYHMCIDGFFPPDEEDMSDTIGFVQEIQGETAPENWLPCDGRELVKGDYPELTSVIGNKFGGGTMDDFFNLPNMNGGEKKYAICAKGQFPYMAM